MPAERPAQNHRLAAIVLTGLAGWVLLAVLLVVATVVLYVAAPDVRGQHGMAYPPEAFVLMAAIWVCPTAWGCYPFAYLLLLCLGCRPMRAAGMCMAMSLGGWVLIGSALVALLGQ